MGVQPHGLGQALAQPHGPAAGQRHLHGLAGCGHGHAGAQCAEGAAAAAETGQGLARRLGAVRHHQLPGGDLLQDPAAGGRVGVGGWGSVGPGGRLRARGTGLYAAPVKAGGASRSGA
jgi:hypothetical protein